MSSFIIGGVLLLRISDCEVLSQTGCSDELKEIARSRGRSTGSFSISANSRGFARVEGSLSFIVLTTDEVSSANEPAAQRALDALIENFNQMLPQGVAHAEPYEIDRAMKTATIAVKSRANSFIDPLKEKTSRVKNAIEDAKNVALDNVRRVVDRGERLENLIIQSDDLQATAEGFQQRSRQLRNRIRWNNMKIQVFIVAAVLIFLLLIYIMFY